MASGSTFNALPSPLDGIPLAYFGASCAKTPYRVRLTQNPNAAGEGIQRGFIRAGVYQ
jgi:hypothetical protein